MMKRLGAQTVQVRKPQQLDALDGLILPGGESTTMGLVAERWGLVEPLRGWVRSGRPVWGTCAGLILLAERATGQKAGGQPLIGGLDVTVSRNYFGRQSESFESFLVAPVPGDPPVRALFIRAPAIVESGEQVTVLATVAGHAEEEVAVAVSQGTLLATAFHPELTDDLRWHAFFLERVRAGS